jgi:hypothetical protein
MFGFTWMIFCFLFYSHTCILYVSWKEKKIIALISENEDEWDNEEEIRKN